MRLKLNAPSAVCAALMIFPLLAGSGLHAAIPALSIDPTRTTIEFAVDAVGWPRTTGHFSSFSGRIAIDLQRPDASSVAFRVSSKSIDVGSPSFDDYLRGDAFFDVVHFPDITFTSNKVEKIDDRHARVTGDLTLRGVTRPFAVEVEVERAQRNPNALRFRATGMLHRLEFGMSAGFPAISNDVNLTIATEAEATAQ